MSLKIDKKMLSIALTKTSFPESIQFVTHILTTNYSLNRSDFWKKSTLSSTLWICLIRDTYIVPDTEREVMEWSLKVTVAYTWTRDEGHLIKLVA